jgi:hypothetical protein
MTRRCRLTCCGWGLAFAAPWACVSSVEPESCAAATTVAARPGPVTLDGPCALDGDRLTRLLVTTTDFATGAVSIVDTATMQVTPDVALGSTDAIPSWHDDLALLVHRYQIDEVQVLDPARAWATIADIPIEASCSATPNPQAVAFGPDGLGYVTQLDVPELVVIDPRAAPGAALVSTIDLRAIPDADGNPDFGSVVACGSIVWVVAQRLDASFARVGPDELFAVDTIAGGPVDLDAEQPGAQGLPSAGAWLRQLRRDPGDPNAHTLLGLSTGIERFDLEAQSVAWVVTPERFAAADIGAPLQPQAFAVDAAGAVAYVAAYDGDFSQVQLYRVGLGDGAPQVPEAFADGFDSVERTLERVGDRLWYGSTRRSAPGLWVFDLGDDPPSVLAGPLSTGLPPYSLVAIP